MRKFLANENYSHYFPFRMCDRELDTILASLASPLGPVADTLLDLRQWAHSSAGAGSCIRAYFELLSESPATKEVSQSLAALRCWLERRLSILVFDDNRSVCLDALPLVLSGETNLEQYCYAAMRSLRDDRCHSASQLRLEFRFNKNSSIAA